MIRERNTLQPPSDTPSATFPAALASGSHPESLWRKMRGSIRSLLRRDPLARVLDCPLWMTIEAAGACKRVRLEIGQRGESIVLSAEQARATGLMLCGLANYVDPHRPTRRSRRSRRGGRRRRSLQGAAP